MTNKEAISYITERLDNEIFVNPKVIAKQIICFFNNLSQTELYFELDNKFNNKISKVDNTIKKLNNFLPLEYITNTKYFLENKFYVNKKVLIPRPETEELVLEVIKLIKEKSNLQITTVFDICTGSGVIGITLAKKYNFNFYASDNSNYVLNIAKKNSKNLNVNNITFLKGDFLNPFIKKKLKADLIICNPPYISIKDNDVDFSTLKYEPKKALFSKTGLEFYEKLFKNYKKITNDNSIIAFEFGHNQKETLDILINKYFDLKNTKYKFLKDLNNKYRFLFIYIKKGV